jgi:hypothetical protein
MVFPDRDGQLVHRLSAATLSFFIASHNLDPGKLCISRHLRTSPNKQWLNCDLARPIALGCAAGTAWL